MDDRQNRTERMERMTEKENWIIEARDVSFSYEGDDKKALDHISLKIRKGSRVAFMGGNGSGKSTFFLCLNGIHRPDSGTISIDGKPVRYQRKGLLDVRRKVGIVFQEPDDQLFSASVYEEISFGVQNLGVDEARAKQEVERVIEELDIAPFQDRPVHASSGGQKKQVAIADILVMHPEVMILDEPASALDPVHTRKVRGIVDRLADQGITVLMATHDIDYAYAWSDEIVLLHEGKVLRQGTPDIVCADREALKQAGMEAPTVLRMYGCLREKGLFADGSAAPRSMEGLLRLLEQTENRKG